MERPGNIELLPLSYGATDVDATDVDATDVDAVGAGAVGAGATVTAEQTDQVCGDRLKAMADYVCRTVSECKGWKRVLLGVSGVIACVLLSPILIPLLIYVGIILLIALAFVDFADSAQ
ncbi:MAG: hypothetical protein OXF02_04570 [Simkaniaceae bacterium]|nr:hypothetical protein [Simkaniaceae bacterium]